MGCSSKARAKQLIDKGIGSIWGAKPGLERVAASGEQPQEKVGKFGANSAFGRSDQPLELPPVSVLLASQERRVITGEVYGATGGASVA